MDSPWVGEGRGIPEDRLAEVLTALANPVRLRLLQMLKKPRVLKELEVRPGRAEERVRPRRAISRQGVKQHLERMIDAGIVVARETEREYGPTMEYVADHRALYLVSQHLQALAELPMLKEGQGPRVEAPLASKRQDVEPPYLLLVKGVREGRIFSLDAEHQGVWRIGGDPEAEVPLTYDPFAAEVEAQLSYTGGRFRVEPAEDCTHLPCVNFEPLEDAKGRELSDGDLLGIGASLLLLRT